MALAPVLRSSATSAQHRVQQRSSTACASFVCCNSSFDGVPTIARYSRAVPEVTEAYRQFTPPCNAKATVEDLLDSVSPEHLLGLKSVVLTNSGALSATRRKRWSWSRGRKARHRNVAGLYYAESRQQDAWIEVFVDQVVADTPAWALRWRLVRTVLFAPVLFHEVGHHIHARVRPEHREREDVADEWAKRLRQEYVRRRHAIARIILLPLVWISRRPSRDPRPGETSR